MIEPIEPDTFPPAPLAFFYDEQLDVLTIEGIKYSGQLFRVLAVTGPSDQAFKITGNEDGKLTLQKVEAPL